MFTYKYMPRGGETASLIVFLCSVTCCSRRQAHSTSRIVATQIAYLMIRSVQALLDICQQSKQLFYSLQFTCLFALQCYLLQNKYSSRNFMCMYSVHEYNVLLNEQRCRERGNVCQAKCMWIKDYKIL